jgi:hypothetical protein
VTPYLDHQVSIVLLTASAVWAAGVVTGERIVTISGELDNVFKVSNHATIWIVKGRG